MLIKKDMPMPKNNFIIPKLGYYSFPSTTSDFSFLNKIKSLKKHDEQNNKLSMELKHWGMVINSKVYIAKTRNLFRFKNKDWVYYPRISTLYNKIISGEIEEYYEEIKKDMKKKNYLFKDKNKYNKKHIQLIKNGGNSFYK
jgi:hypothetical protein